MSASHQLEFYGLGSGLLLVGAGAYAILRSVHLARRNRAYLASGKETYFEEKRAREHYPSGRPETDPDRIRRGGWFMLALGSLLVLLWSPISIFRWGWFG